MIFPCSNIYPACWLFGWFLKNCELVMTDSGGLQKEAYFFGKLCDHVMNRVVELC